MEFVNGEWRFYNSLDKPIPALYVQFIPEEAGKSLTFNKLQINGCRLGESSICLQICPHIKTSGGTTFTLYTD